jgi:hypothetical protein
MHIIIYIHTWYTSQTYIHTLEEGQREGRKEREREREREGEFYAYINAHMYRDDIQMRERKRDITREQERDTQKRIFPKHVCVRSRVCVHVSYFTIELPVCAALSY